MRRSGIPYVITAEKKGYSPAVELELTITEEDIKNKIKELIEEAKSEVEKALKLLSVENPKIVEVCEEFEIRVTHQGLPVSNVTVTISKQGIVVRVGKTDMNGIFRSSLDEKDVYVIKATKEGYRSGKSVVAVVPTIEVKPMLFVHIMPVIEPEKPSIVEVGTAFINELEIKTNFKSFKNIFSSK